MGGSGRGAAGNPRRRAFLFPKASIRAEAAEDYAIRKVPSHWKLAPSDIASITGGTVTSVFAFALGGSLALAYGMGSAIVAGLVGLIVGIPLAWVFARQGANSSMDIDLITRGAGFGYMGSTFTSLIYGLMFIMYAAFETAFIGASVHVAWALPPLWLVYLCAAFLFVLLGRYGLSQVNWLQTWSLPLFAIGLVWLLVVAASKSVAASPHPITVSAVVQALAPVFANVVVFVLLAGDIMRFSAKRQVRKSFSLFAIVAFGGEFVVMVGLGAFMAEHVGNANVGGYAARLLGAAGLLWILVTQIRVQLANYYSGSLAFANFFSRVTHWNPGRQNFLFVVAIGAFLFAQLGIVNYLATVLTVLGVFVVAWMGSLFCALTISRRSQLRNGEAWLEHRRGYLRNWGWPSIVSMLFGSAVGAYFAVTGYPAPYGGILGITVGFVLGGGLTIALNGVVGPDFVLARRPPRAWRDQEDDDDIDLQAPERTAACGVCGQRVMKADACECPVTAAGVICSACCAQHRTCGDRCKVSVGLARPAGVAMDPPAI